MVPSQSPHFLDSPEEISELLKQCQDLLPVVQERAATIDRIDRLAHERDELSGKLLSGRTKVSEEEAKLLVQIASLETKIDKLHKPFEQTRERVLALVKCLRESLRVLPMDTSFVQIRDDLEKLPLFSYLNLPAFFLFSMDQAQLDLKVVQYRLYRCA